MERGQEGEEEEAGRELLDMRDGLQGQHNPLLESLGAFPLEQLIVMKCRRTPLP